MTANVWRLGVGTTINIFPLGLSTRNSSFNPVSFALPRLFSNSELIHVSKVLLSNSRFVTFPFMIRTLSVIPAISRFFSSRSLLPMSPAFGSKRSKATNCPFFVTLLSSLLFYRNHILHQGLNHYLRKIDQQRE